jgi:hypothetical protein
MNDVTAVLITRENQWPADAVLDFPFSETLIGTKSPNVWRRYQLAAEAHNPTIYFQDDDCRIDVAHLYRFFDGEHLTHAITPGHWHIYNGTGVTLIGWGSFFPRTMVEDFMEHEGFWRNKFGDEIFENETDRLFTYANQPHNSIFMPITQFQRPVKMCERPGHYAVKDMVLRTLREM